jgi:hypothetical protein
MIQLILTLAAEYGPERLVFWCLHRDSLDQSASAFGGIKAIRAYDESIFGKLAVAGLRLLLIDRRLVLLRGHLEKLVSIPVARCSRVNVHESERERNGII